MWTYVKTSDSLCDYSNASDALTQQLGDILCSPPCSTRAGEVAIAILLSLPQFRCHQQRVMIEPPLPTNEVERLKMLYDLMLLDTTANRQFDRVVQFACAEFNVPIALISLVDRDRQWFKSQVGLTQCDAARDVSFFAPMPLSIPNCLLFLTRARTGDLRITRWFWDRQIFVFTQARRL